jgi:ribosomal protein L37AE/L43A
VEWNGVRHEAVCETCGKQIERVRSGVWRAEKASQILFQHELKPSESVDKQGEN